MFWLKQISTPFAYKFAGRFGKIYFFHITEFEFWYYLFILIAFNLKKYSFHVQIIGNVSLDLEAI